MSSVLNSEVRKTSR